MIPPNQHSSVIGKLQVLASVGAPLHPETVCLPPQDLLGEDVRLCDVPVLDMFGRRSKESLKVESLEIYSQR